MIAGECQRRSKYPDNSRNVDQLREAIQGALKKRTNNGSAGTRWYRRIAEDEVERERVVCNRHGGLVGLAVYNRKIRAGRGGGGGGGREVEEEDGRWWRRTWAGLEDMELQDERGNDIKRTRMGKAQGEIGSTIGRQHML